MMTKLKRSFYYYILNTIFVRHQAGQHPCQRLEAAAEAGRLRVCGPRGRGRGHTIPCLQVLAFPKELRGRTDKVICRGRFAPNELKIFIIKEALLFLCQPSTLKGLRIPKMKIYIC